MKEFLKKFPNSLKYPAEYIAYFFGPPCSLCDSTRWAIITETPWFLLHSLWTNRQKLIKFSRKCLVDLCCYKQQQHSKLWFSLCSKYAPFALVPNSTCCTTPPTDELILQLVVEQIHHKRTKICHIPTYWHVDMLGSGIAMWQIYCKRQLPLCTVNLNFQDVLEVGSKVKLNCLKKLKDNNWKHA